MIQLLVHYTIGLGYVARVPILPVPVLSAPSTLGTSVDPVISAPSTLGTREHQVISAPSSLGTSEDPVNLVRVLSGQARIQSLQFIVSLGLGPLKSLGLVSH